MRSEFLGKLTLGAVTSGMMMYFLNTNKRKRRGYGFDGYDTDDYRDETLYDDDAPDDANDMDVSIKESPNRIQPGDVSSTHTPSSSEELVICNLDDMVYSNLTVIIPDNRYKKIGGYVEYVDYERLEEYFE
jgi:hypothetical protein|tara:strand:- start:74 stop:466 length:393 start_codon:yes stop_codon:yes gene_type:complete